MTNATPRIAAVDDRAAGNAAGLGAFIDESGLADDVIKRNPNYGAHRPHPFRAYCEKVIEKAGVPSAQETREMASVICGAVARLPFLPDDKTKVPDGLGGETTEFEQQIVKTAKRAEEALDSEMVWTASAVKLARAALELRKQDPDGKKKIAWVNEPLEPVAAAA